MNEKKQDVCERCTAPLPDDRQDSGFHEKCEMINQLSHGYCPECGGKDPTFIVDSGNLILYHTKCGASVLNPHE